MNTYKNLNNLFLKNFFINITSLNEHINVMHLYRFLYFNFCITYAELLKNEIIKIDKKLEESKKLKKKDILFFYDLRKCKLFFFKILWILLSNFLKYIDILKKKEYDDNKKNYKINYFKKKYIEKGHKYNNLGIYLNNLNNFNYLNNKLYLQNLKNLYKSYYYLLIRLNRKNLFLTLLNNEGNVLCKTNVGACGFKKKVKYTGYAIKRTGKKFFEKIKFSLLKSIFILYKKNLKNKNKNKKNFEKIQNLAILEKKKDKKIKKNIIRKKIKKRKKKIIIIKKIKKNIILKKNLKKIIRSKLLWVKIYNNLKKYRIYYNIKLSNLIKKNIRIIYRVKSSLKLWAFRFVIYGLFKKLPWFRGIEFRLPIPHSNGLRLKKKRRV